MMSNELPLTVENDDFANGPLVTSIGDVIHVSTALIWKFETTESDSALTDERYETRVFGGPFNGDAWVWIDEKSAIDNHKRITESVRRKMLAGQIPRRAQFVFNEEDDGWEMSPYAVSAVVYVGNVGLMITNFERGVYVDAYVNGEERGSISIDKKENDNE